MKSALLGEAPERIRPEPLMTLLLTVTRCTSPKLPAAAEANCSDKGPKAQHPAIGCGGDGRRRGKAGAASVSLTLKVKLSLVAPELSGV